MAFSSSTVTIGANTKKSDYDRLQANIVSIRDDTTTFGSVKTFTSKPLMDGVQTRSGTGSVSIETQYLSSAGNSVVDLKTKIIEIGDWDMDATQTLSITHSITDPAKIRKVEVQIRPDSAIGNGLYDLAFWDGTVLGGISYLDPSTDTTIWLERTLNGFFDSVNFNESPFNRGFITITYEV